MPAIRARKGSGSGKRLLDWQDEVQAAVTLIGTDPVVIRPDSEPVNRLKGFCKKHSLEKRS